MSLPRAAALLWTASVRNRVLRQVRRLKNPRYLVATLVGLAYFWSFFVRRLSFSGAARGIDPSNLPFAEASLTVLGLLVVLGAWVLGANRAQVEFSEAEVQFLFPAPVSRRALLWFKVAKSLLRTLLSAAGSTLFVGGALSSHRGFFFIGAWLCFSTLGLHTTAASLARESLARHGRFGVLRRPLTLAVVLAVVGALAASVRLAPAPPALDGAEGLGAALDWFVAILDQPPLSWVLLPIRAPLRVALAPTLGTLLAALPAAALVLVAHALWLVTSDVTFEEAAVEAAEARARRMERRRATALGRGQVGTSGRGFRLALSPRGRPELALLWKNVIAARRTSATVLLLVMLLFGVGATLAGLGLLRNSIAASPVLAVLAVTCAVMAGFLTVLGPSVLRVDLRQDLPLMDILRSLPLSGTQVVRAELMAPGLLLAAGQWLLLGLGLALSVRVPIEGLTVGERSAVVLGVALVAPWLSLAGLVVQNTAVLLFPGWVVVDRNQPRGFEAMGQRLLTTFGTLLVLGLAVVPAVLAAGLTWLALGYGAGLGLYAAPFAGAAGAAVVAVELLFATRLMGALFARFDLTE